MFAIYTLVHVVTILTIVLMHAILGSKIYTLQNQIKTKTDKLEEEYSY